MKLIALKDFRNNLDIEVDGSKHESHIHKGAIFDYGRGTTLEDANKAEQVNIGQLALAGCVADASNKESVDRVKAEVAGDEKREKSIAKQNAAATAAVTTAPAK